MPTSPMLASAGADVKWPGGNRDGDPFVRISSDAAFQRLVAWKPGDGCRVDYRFPGGNGSLVTPFCSRPLDDIALDGGRLAFVSPGIVADGKGSYRVTVISADGDTLFARDYEYTPTDIPPGLADCVMKAAMQEEERPEALAAWRAMKVPSAYPPLSRVLVDRDGTIWLEKVTTSGDRQWRILAEDGSIASELAVPRRVWILVAASEAFWGTDTDDDGLQSIVKYRCRVRVVAGRRSPVARR